MQTGQPNPAPALPTAESHPKGLYVLFLTEMWERFSYYGMRALLVLYMVNYFKWSQDRASNIYKWYTSLVYLTPLIGGYLADRYLGNKRAVVIGAALMAIGHFLMAFDAVNIFYIALVFLILGNGMFKPNMSSQVGRLYPKNDPRRDGAYTIFYMGINIGAGLSPLVCGWLHENYGFHYGFGAAGVGMLLGMITYLIGIPLVKEIADEDLTPQTIHQPIAQSIDKPTEKLIDQPIHRSARHARFDSTEHASPGKTPSPAEPDTAFPTFSRLAPVACFAFAALIAALGLCALVLKKSSLDNAFIVEAAAGVLIACGLILRQTHGAARDRVIAIYAIVLFVIFFWFAFEQAGNAMNLWADQVTDRYITTVAPAPSLLPPVASAIGFPQPVLPPLPPMEFWQKVVIAWHSYWNPVSTESFQSINSAAIILFAPLLAWLWTFLGRRNRDLSIATKMTLGILLMGAGFAVMLLPAKLEDKESTASLSLLPTAMHESKNQSLQYVDPADLNPQQTPFDPNPPFVPAQAGRLYYRDGQLRMRGVLSEVERDRILRATVPESFIRQAMDLSNKTISAAGKTDTFTVSVEIDPVPPAFDLKWTGFNPQNLHFDPSTNTLTAENIKLADKDYKTLLLAAAPPAFRNAVNELYVSSARYKVGSSWLVWFYLFSTLGELCLSPVGLSMASKLAPAKFATSLMGVWLLTTFFGNFAAGALGEFWGTVPPTTYFLVLVLALTLAAALLALLVPPITRLMHGIK